MSLKPKCNKTKNPTEYIYIRLKILVKNYSCVIVHSGSIPDQDNNFLWVIFYHPCWYERATSIASYKRLHILSALWLGFQAHWIGWCCNPCVWANNFTKDILNACDQKMSYLSGCECQLGFDAHNSSSHWCKMFFEWLSCHSKLKCYTKKFW